MGVQEALIWTVAENVISSSSSSRRGRGGGDKSPTIILLSHADEQLFTITAFYPETGLLMKRTDVTQTACYPESLVPEYNFLCTNAYPNIAQNTSMCILFYIPQGGCGARQTLKSRQVPSTVTCENC